MPSPDALPPTPDSADPSWYQALRVAERRGAGLADGGDEVALREARATVARWRGEAGLADDPLFAERLAREGLTESEVLAILAEPPRSLARRVLGSSGPPPWLETLTRAYSGPTEAGRPEPPGSAREPPDTPRRHLAALLGPLLTSARRDLGARVAAFGPTDGRIDVARVLAALTATLADELEALAERSLVLELHLRRLAGRLPGDDSQARFRAFAESLREPGEALGILRSYPVLARTLAERARAWTETGAELIERFLRDRAEIVGALGDDGDPGALTEVRTGLGDRHDGGRTVARLTFETGWTLFYKPRSLAVDAAFGELVGWLARHRQGTGAPTLRTPRVLDRGSHGWAEAVVARPCASEGDVERFYERQGAWAALLYAVDAADFHYENVVADGEHPVPVDLETVFQPLPDDPTPVGPGSNPMRETVLGSGLLPRRAWGDVEAGGLDLTALGAAPRREVAARRLARRETDDLRYELATTALPETAHLPRLDGRPVPAWPRRRALVRGFRAMYGLLHRERDRLVAPAGPLARFEEVEVRVIARGTTIYVRLLDAASHPDYLRSGLQQTRLLDKLWLEAAHIPSLRPLAASESAALARRDVPRFRARVGSHHLELPGGGRLDDWLAASGLERVRERLARLGPDDRELQSDLLERSLETLRPPGERVSWPPRVLGGAVAPAPPERFLAAAAGIGRELRRRAVHHRDHVSWMSLRPMGDAGSLAPVSVDLYSGLPGIALFLAHLGAATRDGDASELARRAVDTVRARIRANPRAVNGGAGLGGWGGVVYALARLADLWGDDALLADAERLAETAAAGIGNDRAFDLIGGAAGLVAGVLAVHRLRPSDALLAAAVRCGDHLLAHATETDPSRGGGRKRGLGWPPPPAAGEVPLTGFGHGSAGLSWVLGRLAPATGAGRFEAAAHSALAYERSWFSPERGSWADVREDRRTAEGPGFTFAWCHGAPGIGLGRIGLLECLEDDRMEDEIRTAAGATLAEGFGGNHSLCHGDLGNLESVIEAARVLEDRELARQADETAAAVLASIEGEGPRCGSHTGDEPPGLFTGLAGIGYGLLRLGAPDQVPSVLRLEPVVARAKSLVRPPSEDPRRPGPAPHRQRPRRARPVGRATGSSSRSSSSPGRSR